jgi:hypothetical protein
MDASSILAALTSNLVLLASVGALVGSHNGTCLDSYSNSLSYANELITFS